MTWGGSISESIIQPDRDSSDLTGGTAQTSDFMPLLLNPYRRYFDIYENKTLFGKTIPATAEFHSRGEKYVLSKKAKLWGVENHEYVFFFKPSHLTVSELNEIISFLKAAEKHFVKPHDEHMYTYLTAVIAADSADPAAEKDLRRFKMRKNYLFSLHGWSIARMVLIDIDSLRQEETKCVSNKDGDDVRKMFLKELKERKI